MGNFAFESELKSGADFEIELDETSPGTRGAEYFGDLADAQNLSESAEDEDEFAVTSIMFEKQAWREFMALVTRDKTAIKRVEKLVDDITRNGPGSGIGRPQLHRFGAPGTWNRKITDEHKLVYSLDSSRLIIKSCKGDYY